MKRKSWLLLTLLLFLVACGGRTPPGANMGGGQFEDVAYTTLEWPGGQRLLFVHAAADGSCGGSGSTLDPVYTVTCTAAPFNGVARTWTAETADGRTISLTIDGVPYNVAQGPVFVLTEGAGGTAVTQLQRDLSVIPFMHEEIVALMQSDPELSAFLAEMERAAP